MVDFFSEYFFLIDFVFSAMICLIVLLLYIINRIEKSTWYLYWIGFCLGMCWEFTMVFCTETGIFPFYEYLMPLPTHFMVIVIAHSLWDGGLFLVGYGLVKKICAKPTFERFKKNELGIMLIWGQLQNLAVEFMSTYANAWEYIPYWWNPTIFVFNGHIFTLLPQIIWVIAPIVFYYATLKLNDVGV